MIRSTLARTALGASTLLLPFLAFNLHPSSWQHDDGLASDQARNRYVGAKACKNCHKATHKGEQAECGCYTTKDAKKKKKGAEK